MFNKKEEQEEEIKKIIRAIISQDLSDLKRKEEKIYLLQQEVIKNKTFLENETRQLRGLIEDKIFKFKSNIEDANQFKDLLLQVMADNRQLRNELQTLTKLKTEMKVVSKLYKKERYNQLPLSEAEKKIYDVYNKLKTDPNKLKIKTIAEKTGFSVNMVQVLKTKMKQKGFILYFPNSYNKNKSNNNNNLEIQDTDFKVYT